MATALAVALLSVAVGCLNIEPREPAFFIQKIVMRRRWRLAILIGDTILRWRGHALTLEAEAEHLLAALGRNIKAARSFYYGKKQFVIASLEPALAPVTA